MTQSELWTVCEKTWWKKYKDRWMEMGPKESIKGGSKMVKNRPVYSTMYSAPLLSWPVSLSHCPCDRLTDIQKGTLIVFCQGLAVTQGLFSINKQVVRKMAAISPSLLWVTVSFTPDVSLLPPPYSFSWVQKGTGLPITHLLSPWISSSNIAPQKAEYFLTMSPNKSWLGEVEAKYILIALLNETHISYCSSFIAVFFIFTARLPKPDADGRKSCHYCPLFFLPSLLRLFLCQLLQVLAITPPPSPPPSPSNPPSFPLGYKLNLINDLLCLACLPLAMFSKWSNGNVSSVCASRIAD